ncbi:MAG TPA: aldehyde dehydrogenase family protein [Thermoanaerobaculia bacterium]|nr:aldehyde dehydrogenase family protein [Thermoanaerobaculia bacterium]
MELDRRLELLHRLADAISCAREGLVNSIVRTSKKTRRVAEGEVDLALKRLRAFDHVAGLLAGREPVGTVAIVFPGNASLSNPVATIGTAFLAGNRVVARFPRSSRAWADQVEPLLGSHLEGVAFDDRPGPDFMRTALADPEIAVVMVFGDDAWADPYEPLVRDFRKKLIFEGPGKDPFLVLPGADVEKAAQDAVRGGFYNSGQACTSPERFYVHRDLVRDFTDRVVALAHREVVGAPERADTTIGPIVSRRVAGRIAGQLADAVARGARVLTGGGMRDVVLDDGTPATYIEPTVLAGATPGMRVMREETFGPVIPIQEVGDAAEALALAGDSPYGLAANLYGGGEADAATLAASHGQVFQEEIWLDYFGRNLHAPYGGRKRSGWVWEWADGRFARRDGTRANAVEFTRRASFHA